MGNIVRSPKQERSIEKKRKIISSAYELFSNVGYYGTNTVEIAKKAGVSTGIVYSYFNDKKDILIEVLELYINKVITPLMESFESLSAPVNFKKLISSILDKTISAHKKNSKIHEVLHSLAPTDKTVNMAFIDLEDSITLKFTEKFEELNIPIDNPKEKIHFAMDIIQSFAHEYVFDKHTYIDYEKMKEMVIETVDKIFE